LIRHDATAAPLNLRTLHALRWVAIAVELLLVLMGKRWFGNDVALGPALAICAGQAVLNGFSLWRLRRHGELAATELFVQLLIDLFALTAISGR
jgi:hypothetical protein